MQSSSSTTSLLASTSSSAHLSSSKRWEASFGKLVSSYGFGGAIPGPSLPPKSKNEKTVTSNPVSAHSANAFVSKSEKDYEAAFGALSSSYGFAAVAQSSPPKSAKKAKSSKLSSSAVPSSQPATMKTSQPKDYQGAFGDLSSSYGFGGAAAPSWSTKK